MINGIDIKKSIIEIVKSKYKYKFLKNEVEEDFSTPSFFLSVITDISDVQTVNVTRKFFDIVLKIYGLEHNKMIEMAGELHKLFPLNIRVYDEDIKKHRFILLKNKKADIEDYEKYMEFSFSLDFMDRTRDITEEDTVIDYSKNYEEEIIVGEEFEKLSEVKINLGKKED